MDEFLVEKNSFEIVAILRDIYLKKIELIIFSENNPVFISAVDYNGFEISRIPSLTASEGEIKFIVKSNGMMLVFFALQEKENNSHCQRFFSLPKEIDIYQRRLTPRFIIDSKFSFRCRGRFTDGFNYNFKIINISQGGCGMVIDQKSQYKTANLTGKELRNALLDFGDQGTMNISLLIVNDIVEKKGERLISCKFKKYSTTNKKLLDKVIVRLLIDEKKNKH